MQPPTARWSSTQRPAPSRWRRSSRLVRRTLTARSSLTYPIHWTSPRACPPRSGCRTPTPSASAPSTTEFSWASRSWLSWPSTSSPCPFPGRPGGRCGRAYLEPHGLRRRRLPRRRARLLGGRGVCRRPSHLQRAALHAAQPQAARKLRPAVGVAGRGALPVARRGGRARQGGAVLHGGGLLDLRGGILGSELRRGSRG